MFPSFLCIGAPRSGTTWLHMNLKEHPRIWMPPVKELHYFDDKEELDSLPLTEALGSRYKRYRKRWKRVSNCIKMRKKSDPLDAETLRWCFRYLLGFCNDSWYASLFEASKGKAAGEITPAYGHLKAESVAHIHKLMPEAKIIFLMRNPMQRAWSHFLKQVRNDKRPLESVSDAEFIDHFDSDHSRIKGSYSRILKTWMSHYPKEQLFTAFFEEISICPEELLLRLFDFLGVEASSNYISSEKSAKKYNASSDSGILPDNLAIPDSFGVHLARIYCDEIEYLNDNFGGYASNWIEDVNRLLKLAN